MNVTVKSGSQADYARRSGTPAAIRLASSKEIAGGIGATPEQDLKYRGGKTIPNLEFVNIYVRREQFLGSERHSNDRSSGLAACNVRPGSEQCRHAVLRKSTNHEPVASFPRSAGRAPRGHHQRGCRKHRRLPLQARQPAPVTNSTVRCSILMLPRGTVLTRMTTRRLAKPLAAQAPAPTTSIARKKDIPIEDGSQFFRGTGRISRVNPQRQRHALLRRRRLLRTPRRWNAEWNSGLRQVMEERRRHLLSRIERGPDQPRC